MISKRMGLDAAFAIVALIGLNAVMGCGGQDSDRGTGSATAKVTAVDVTYYYLPG